MTTRGCIVVGVDGSDCSRAALEFALDEAGRRGAAVRVVAAMPEAADTWSTAYGMSLSLLHDVLHATVPATVVRPPRQQPDGARDDRMLEKNFR